MRTDVRSELKYVIHHSVRRMLLERWDPHLVHAPFTDDQARTPILSQYYDSPTLSFCREKDDGVPIRNKVRLRAYATDFDSGGTAFLEIKHRRNLGVHKHRQRIDQMSSDLLCPTRWTFDDPDIAARFHSLLETYRLRASAQTYYQREAYEAASGDGLRVTLDSNLIALHPDERLTSAMLRDPGRSLLPSTQFILEIKANTMLPRWIHDGIVACELDQKTIPKYITAVDVLNMHQLTGSGVY
jgi:hypothetical protein